MAPHRSFTLPDPDHQPGPNFDLANENFRCVRVAPPAVLAAMLNSIQFGGSGETQFRVSGLISFIQGCVTDYVWEVSAKDVEQGAAEPAWTRVEVDDWSRFSRLIRGSDHEIPVEVLGEIASWLAEYYLDRPTGAPTP